jgi:hypothetical protein
MAVWNILRTFGKFYGHLVHFVFIWYIVQVLVSCTKKNLATLSPTHLFKVNTYITSTVEESSQKVWLLL